MNFSRFSMYKIMSFANREIEIVLLLPLQSVLWGVCMYVCICLTTLVSPLSKIFNRSDKSRRHACLVLIPWCWERLKAGGEGDDRGWDGWMASLTGWTRVWASSGSMVMDREAWYAVVHGVAKSWTWLND